MSNQQILGCFIDAWLRKSRKKGAVPKKMVRGWIRFRTYFENPHGHEWGNLPSRCQFCGQGPFCNPHAWSNHNPEPQSRSLDSESMNCKMLQWALKLWAQADHEFDGGRKVALGEWPGPGDNTVVRNVALQLKTSSHIPHFGIVTQIFAWARAWPPPTEGSSIQPTPVLFKSAEAKIASMGVLAFRVWPWRVGRRPKFEKNLAQGLHWHRR